MFIFAPLLDNIFTKLDESETNTEIFIEIINQIIAIAVFWYLLSEYVVSYINILLNVKNHPIINKTKEVVGAVVIIGLQRNLIRKLEYITYEHPFRVF